MDLRDTASATGTRISPESLALPATQSVDITEALNLATSLTDDRRPEK